MSVKEYISSGIIESYVLGLADAAERAEFERMCDMYPEVRQAREAFEIALEQQATFNQVQPPSNLKSKIFAGIDIEKDQLEGEKEIYRRPPITPAPIGNTRAAKVASMQPRWQRFIAAAAVILLIASTALNLYFFNRARYYSGQYRELLAQNARIVSNNQVMQTRMLEYEKAVEMMKDPNMSVVKMPAVPAAPDPTSTTTVYWNTITKDVFLAINKLPAPDENHQYQLWAMVDGKPVDAGVFDIAAGPGMVKMKNIPRAEAFAITLEKKGGSPTPTLDKLYVMGKV